MTSEATSTQFALTAELLARLRQIAKNPPSALAVCASALLGEQVAAQLGRLIAPTERAYQNDVHLLAPAGPSWSIAEIDQTIRTAGEFVPTLRNVIVVLDAHKMAPAGFDHLLKLIEEPLAPTTYVLCVDEIGALPPTIRGRLTHAINANADPATLAHQLESRGLDSLVAARVCELIPEVAASLAPLANDNLLKDILDHIAHPSSSPTSNSLILAELITQAAEKISKADPSPATPTLVNRRARAFGAAVLASWRRTLVDSATDPGTDLETTSLRLTRIERALGVLAVHGPLDIALALGSF